MRLGTNVGYWGVGLSSEDQLAIVQEAERLGFDSVWAAEAYGSDTATVLAWLASQTSKINIGSAVFQIPGRTPAMTAMTAATLDHLSNGRFKLGLGTSGPAVSEGWHGVRFGKQLKRTREYFDVVRMALRRERVIYDGETIQLPLPDGPGKALKLTIPTIQDEIPMYLAAIGPKNTELAGEIADGWLPFLFAPEFVGEFKTLLEAGAAKAGKTLENFDIAPNVNVAIGDDIDETRDLMRPILALYIGGMGTRENNFYNNLVKRYGFEEAAEKVQTLYLDGKKDEAAAEIPGELIDQVTICGPADKVKARLDAYRDAGVGTLIATPMAWTKPDRIEQLQKLAELAG